MNYSLDPEVYYDIRTMSEQRIVDVMCSPYKLKKSGTKQIGQGITMTWGPGLISLNAQFEVAGNAVTPGVVAHIKKAIEDSWNTEFGDLKAICHVTIRHSSQHVLDPAYSWIMCNKKVSDDKDGAPHVHWNRGLYTAYTCLATEGEYSIIKNPYIVAHEFGHLLGLWDRYTESRKKGKRITTPHQGWTYTLMADGGALAYENLLGLLYLHTLEPGQQYKESDITLIDHFHRQCIANMLGSSIHQTNNYRFKNAIESWKHRLYPDPLWY